MFDYIFAYPHCPKLATSLELMYYSSIYSNPTLIAHSTKCTHILALRSNGRHKQYQDQNHGKHGQKLCTTYIARQTPPNFYNQWEHGCTTLTTQIGYGHDIFAQVLQFYTNNIILNGMNTILP